MPDCCGVVPFFKQLTDPDEVSERHRHLAPLYEKVLHVHPVPDEGVTRRAFRLGYLILVVRENQIFPAEVHVQSVSQLHRTHH